MSERPLSPHLTVYKFKYTLATSILNRLAGLVLSVGLLLLVYWLAAIAAGVRAYAQARELLSLGAYHLAAGLRHLVWDTGRGLSRASAQRSAWVIAVASLVATLILIYCLLRPGAYAP